MIYKCNVVVIINEMNCQLRIICKADMFGGLPNKRGNEAERNAFKIKLGLKCWWKQTKKNLDNLWTVIIRSRVKPEEMIGNEIKEKKTLEGNWILAHQTAACWWWKYWKGVKFKIQYYCSNAFSCKNKGTWDNRLLWAQNRHFNIFYLYFLSFVYHRKLKINTETCTGVGLTPAASTLLPSAG